MTVDTDETVRFIRIYSQPDLYTLGWDLKQLVSVLLFLYCLFNTLLYTKN